MSAASEKIGGVPVRIGFQLVSLSPRLRARIRARFLWYDGLCRRAAAGTSPPAADAREHLSPCDSRDEGRPRAAVRHVPRKRRRAKLHVAMHERWNQREPPSWRRGGRLRRMVSHERRQRAESARGRRERQAVSGYALGTGRGRDLIARRTTGIAIAGSRAHDGTGRFAHPAADHRRRARRWRALLPYRSRRYRATRCERRVSPQAEGVPRSGDAPADRSLRRSRDVSRARGAR